MGTVLVDHQNTAITCPSLMETGSPKHPCNVKVSLIQYKHTTMKPAEDKDVGSFTRTSHFLRKDKIYTVFICVKR